MKLTTRGLRRGFDARSGKLEHWRPVVRKWASLTESYVEDVPRDSTYYQNERCNISVLAGAAWQCDWFALEEFSQAKASGARSGRADLWLRPSGRRATEDFVEAKAKDLSVLRPKPEEFAASWLEAALDQAAEIKPDSTTTARVGLAFMRLRVPPSRAQDAERLTLEAVRGLLEVECDLAFWSFPIASRTRAFDYHYVYPGVFCVAKCVASTRRRG